MSEQHTPGPWTPRASKGCLDFGIVVENKFVIAEVFSDIRDAKLRDIEEARANAKLIAASPDLLAVARECEDAIDWCAHECGHSAAAVLAVRLREVIAKATGAAS